MPNLERLKSGSYRYRKMVDGQTIRILFDHKPTESEITKALAEEITKIGDRVPKNAFVNCCTGYIELKRPVLSPSTLKGYSAQIRAMSDDLKRTDVNDITQLQIQREIGDFARTHSAKTTSNFHGFISAVLSVYRPSLHLHTTLPQKVKYEPYTPSEEDIKRILDHAKGTKYSVPFQLGVLGMRRSEVCALDPSDLDGNQLHITKAKVQGDDNIWYVKNLTKTEEGKRTIYLPDALVEEIKEHGFFRGFPGNLRDGLQRMQKELEMPKFRFHDLRGFYASYAHSKGVPDAVIMESGGWKSDYVMKRVYRRAMENDKRKYQKSIADSLL